MTNKLKIGFICDAVDYGTGGIKTYTYNLLKFLKKIDKKNEYFLIHSNYNKNKIYENKNEKIIPILSFPAYRPIRKLFVLPSKLKKMRLDIVHETSQFAPLLKIGKTKIITTVHDLIPLLYPKDYGLLQYAYYRFILPISLNIADKIIVVSKNTKKDLIKYYKIKKDKISVIYNGIDHKKYKRISNKIYLKKFKNAHGINYQYVLYVGRISENKNIDGLIDSFYEVKKQISDIKLIFIGDNPYKNKKIYKKIKKLNIKSDIIYFASVNDEALCSFYNCAECLIFPSKYEGFGLPPLEAMACGCPVITSNMGSLPEVVGNAAIKINPYEINEISQAIKKMLVNKTLRKNLINKGLIQSKKFKWVTCAEKVLKEYENLIG